MQYRHLQALIAACALVGCAAGSSDEDIATANVDSSPSSYQLERFNGGNPRHRLVTHMQAVPWAPSTTGEGTTGGNNTSSSGSDATPAPSDATTPPTDTTPSTTPPTPAPAAPPPVPYRGVNLSSAAFGSALPGTEGHDYTFPTSSEVDYYMGKGMNTFRIEFMWERVQPSANGAFAQPYTSELDALVTYATGKGAHVILNPQNFARYYGNVVGSSAVPNSVFADFWSKLSAMYAGNPNVMFNLVNEPNSMPTEQWVSAANAAIAAIRAAGAPNAIIVPGNAWTGAGSWNDTSYGTSNAVAMLNIVDPGNNVLFEAHEYLDSDASGSSSTCISTSVGVERLTVWVNWLRANGKKGFLGEFAGADNTTCNTAIQNLLAYAMQQTDVLVGWTWWAGGPWWNDYMFTLEPSGTTERPQWSLLSPYLPAP